MPQTTRSPLIRAIAAAVIASPVLLGACGGEALDGFEWDIKLTGTNGNEYTDDLRYRLSFEPESAYVNLAIGPDNFASGQISGCRIDYESVVWGEPRDGFDVRWKIEGTATYQQSSGCDTQLPEGVDWKGEEVFVIVQSEHPDIPPGATYTVDTEGVYVGEAGQ